MAMLGSRRIHYALTDSRGKGLDDLITEKGHARETFDISARNGATFNELVDATSFYLRTHPFDVVYIAGGACDITTLHKKSKRITFDWGTGPALQNFLVSSVIAADTRLKRDFPASKVVFCPLIASEVVRLIGPGPTREQEQSVIEEAVWEFNATIFKINSNRGVFAPALHHLVHRFCKGRRRAYYHHLDDGLHLTGYLQNKWAEEFIKAMALN